MEIVVAVVAGFFVLIGLSSGLLARTSLSAPLVALVTGVVLGPGLGVLPTDLTNVGVLTLAELTLALLLFVDATRVDLSLVLRSGQVPGRMLLLGLPLGIGLGTVAGSRLLGAGVASAFVLACLLAPTDAALGQAVMTDDRVPARVRQALNVESGLNDGLVVPFLAVALVLVEARTSATSDLLLTAAALVAFGSLTGAVLGAGVGEILRRVGWQKLQPAPRQVAVAALPFVAWALAGVVGGNGFVAAFACGIAFQWRVEDAHQLVEFGEDAGDLLSLLTFLVFGAVFIGPAAEALSPRTAVYALLSLTVVRMVPIALSLLGVGLRWSTVAMLGWFGPRGLATVVFSLEVLELFEGGDFQAGEELFGVAAMVVVLSVVLHGVSARPLVSLYARTLPPPSGDPDHGSAAEHQHVHETPMRRASGSPAGRGSASAS